MSNAEQVDRFVQEGFLRIEGGFPRELADAGLPALWQAVQCDPDDPATWTRPVVRVCPENDHLGDQPLSFRAAANTPRLYAAFDRLVGPGRWKPRPNVGMFVVRFPSPRAPGDLGWHVDASIPPEAGFDGEHRGDQDYSAWRVDLTSTGRALLMLFLFSDVTEEDAPTRIRVGSHQDVARLLAAHGGRPIVPPPLDELGAQRPVVSATGAAGTVYLCHPFLVHSGQAHRGRRPRFMAQPPLEPALPFRLERSAGDYSAVETAIRVAFGRT